MKYAKELQYILDNQNLLEKTAELQSNLCDTTGVDPTEAGLIVFDWEDICIHNPFYSHCFRFEVNPIAEYGENFLKSDWMNLDKVVEIHSRFGR